MWPLSPFSGGFLKHKRKLGCNIAASIFSACFWAFNVSEFVWLCLNGWSHQSFVTSSRNRRLSIPLTCHFNKHSYPNVCTYAHLHPRFPASNVRSFHFLIHQLFTHLWAVSLEITIILLLPQFHFKRGRAVGCLTKMFTIPDLFSKRNICLKNRCYAKQN